jgi:hypothetical protein
MERSMTGRGITTLRPVWAAVLVAVLGTAAALVLSPGVSRPQETQKPDRTFLLERRTAGCPVCRKMAESLPPGEFAQDAHSFACAVCHHPHTQKTVTEWRQTCTQSGCHPRAWTYTVFHRIDAKIFADCKNCHVVHKWTANGKDCKSCHGGLVVGDTLTAVADIAGVTTFSHPRHASVECTQCHSVKTRHAETLVKTKADCMSCHHGGKAGVSCAACHGGKTPPDRSVEVPVAMSVWKAPQERRLPFSHERHRSLDCAACHGGGEGAPATRCASCHDKHHNPDANCIGCHQPPPKSAHPMSLHKTGCAASGCHRAGAVPALDSGRSVCMVCHRDKADHNPDEKCADCHMPDTFDN